MSERLKNLSESITSAYGVVDSSIRKHFWCILVILVVTFILTLLKGSDADRLSIASSVLSIALALIVVIFSIVHACDMKEVVKQGWEKTHKEIESLQAISEGEKSPPITDSTEKIKDTMVKPDATAKGYQFDPASVSWMTLIMLYCISKAHEAGKLISKALICSQIIDVLNKEFGINYTTVGMHGFLQGVIYGLVCFLPEGYIRRQGDAVAVEKLPENFTNSVEQRIEREEKETPRGKKFFGSLRPVIDAYFL